jgi:hypothetical protein
MLFFNFSPLETFSFIIPSETNLPTVAFLLRPTVPTHEGLIFLEVGCIQDVFLLTCDDSMRCSKEF